MIQPTPSVQPLNCSDQRYAMGGSRGAGMSEGLSM